MDCFNFQYAVKFICGRSDGQVLSPGEYFTAINIHNPTDSTVVFRYKVAAALPPPTSPPVFSNLKLEPDGALEIDCPHILPDPGGFRKGFVVIESDVDLDIVAVYTVGGRSGQVSIHMERVAPRRPMRLPQPI